MTEPPPRAGAPLPARWLLDEMLGRLARYLRFLGLDAEYVRGWSDERILHELPGSDRFLLTRDRDLARRAPRSLLLQTVEVSDQLRELFAAFPDLPRVPSFVRCTRCNGPLERVPGNDPRPKFACRSCGHQYWEGSHTSRIRNDLARWLDRPSP
jgi:uncharacterized protein